MKILMNGDIYIKKTPDYEEFTFEELEIINMKLDLGIEKVEEMRETMINHGKNVLKLSGTELEVYLFSVNESCTKKIKDLEKKKIEMNEEGKPIFDGYRSFWVLFYDGNTIKMKDQSSEASDKTYNTIEEMEKDFISLRDFLATAEFDGSEFTIGMKINDIMCISIHPNKKKEYGPILTYTYEDRGIIYIPRDMDIGDVPKKEGFEFVDLRDFLSNTSGISPLTHDEFKNPSELYQKIFKQIHDKEKGKEYRK